LIKHDADGHAPVHAADERRPHGSLTITGEDGKGIKRTPALAAGVADHVWTLAGIAELSN
jgi:hypothetical protein